MTKLSKLTINNTRVLNVESGRSLLTSLSDELIYLPSACGGRGMCGACRCEVKSGGGALQPAELQKLSNQEQQSNIRLACQVVIDGNIDIRIPDAIYNLNSFRAIVSDVIDYTYDIKGITFELLKPGKIVFQAGQYVQVETKPYSNIRQKTVRAYSIASKPEDNHIIQLIIRLVPEGLCSTWLHKYLKIGDEVKFTGPYGDFYIRDTDADIIFIAGGSGKAPIKSMLEHLQIIGTKRKMTYFFGARTGKDLYLTEQFMMYEKMFPDFTYIPVLSQCAPEDNYCGRTGYIMPYLRDVIRDPKGTEAYMCGSPGMLDAAQKELLALGVPDGKIYFDRFG